VATAVSTEYVRVRVGAEHYALPVEHVLEVVDLGDLTPVPGCAAIVLGLRNLRGEILPALDVAGIFGLENEGTASTMVVAAAGPRRAGLAVDEVIGVGSIPDVEHDAELPYLSGTTVVDGTLVGVVATPLLLEALGAEDAL
jgi:purine-binding chemotaxis protein CheW